MSNASYVYATVEQVEAITGLQINATSQPSISEAGFIVMRVAYTINAALKAAKYTLPITPELDRQFLARINALGASLDVWHGAVQGTATHPPAEYWEREYNKVLEMLRKGMAVLPLTPPAGGNPNAVFTGCIIREDGYSDRGQRGWSEYVLDYDPYCGHTRTSLKN